VSGSFAHRFVDGLLSLEFADFMPAHRKVFQAVSDHQTAGAKAAILADDGGAAVPALRRLADADAVSSKIGRRGMSQSFFSQ
jgi:hypothetical protein